MRPGTVHGFHLADDSFFKIEPALAPAENFRDRRLAFERSEDRGPNRAVRQVNLAIAPARLEGKSPAPLPETAHLQNLGGGKLIQIADERMARIDALRGGSPARQSADKAMQLPAQISFAAVRRDPPDFLLFGRTDELRFVRFGREADDSQRREMLAGIGGLFERDGGLAFHHEAVEVLLEQRRDGLRQCANHACLDFVDLVENAKGAVLKDRIGVQYEQPGFHNYASRARNS